MSKIDRNMIKRGVVTKASKDDKKYPEAQIESLGAVSNCETLYGYGTHGNSPVGSIVAVLLNQGQEESKMGIAYHPDLRPKSLKEGEFVTGNFLRKSFFKFNDDGSVSLIIQGNEVATFKSDGITFKVPTTMEKTLEVQGATTLTTNVTSNGRDIGDKHTHSAVKTGTDKSGPVV